VSTDLIVLTLNEIQGLKKIMPLVKKEWVNNIIVVDGGSTDGTIEEAKKMGFRVITQEIKGHGGAILAGFNASTADNIVIFGPDGNHSPDEIPRLIEKIAEGYDQVIVSRFTKNSVNLDAGIIDSFGNRMFVFLVNVIFGGHYTDTLNESRIITRKAMLEIKFDAMNMTSTQQMSIRGLKKRQKICEISGNEGKRIGGERKMHSFRVGIQLSWQIIKEIVFWKI
jgi:glycosyltransferase involved in cell wall biosynthesis